MGLKAGKIWRSAIRDGSFKRSQMDTFLSAAYTTITQSFSENIPVSWPEPDNDGSVI
jgi:hypothetical protein